MIAVRVSERPSLSDPDVAVPLAEAKLAPPRPRAEIVPRPRLAVALDAGNGMPLI
jgi:hypothetical protein